ncbi:DUF3283 family protein [Aeromonas veronii]|uniref:DUF3283 family protein n=1 Tax=Aeromonas veronii TaxID=654 RepID=UPI0018F1B5CC|nr:DUF3283 family protein [Aeromonas veronii]MBJ7591975.1 DUF3283 family protein [Aeromonas veronii]
MFNLAKLPPPERLAIELDKQARYLLWQVVNGKAMRDQMLGQLLKHPHHEQLSARVAELERGELNAKADQLITLAMTKKIGRLAIQDAINATPLEHQDYFRGALNERREAAKQQDKETEHAG